MMLAHRTGRGPAPHANDQHVHRRAVQDHRQVAERAMQLDHGRLVISLVESIEIEHVLQAGGAHTDGRLHAFVAPELQQEIAVAPVDGHLERIADVPGDRDRRGQHQ